MLKQLLSFMTCLVFLLFIFAVKSSFGQDLVLHLDFDENLSDLSEFNNNVTAYGDPVYDSDAVVGNHSLRFDGSNDYIEVPGTNLALNEFTVDFFFKADEGNIGGGTVILTKWADANPTNEDGEWFWRGNYEIRFHNNPEGSLASSSWDRTMGEEGNRAWLSPTIPGTEDALILESGEWYNVVYVGSADTTMLQVRNTNGDILAEAGRAPLGEYATDDSQPLRLGWAHHVDMGEASPWLYAGLFDDLRIYNYARVDAEGNYEDPRTEAVSSEVEPTTPQKIKLSQNYPNPFNPSTNIEFTIPSTGLVNLTVFDVIGKEVAVLVNENRNSGTHSVNFNADHIPSGVYYYRLQTESGVIVKAMTLIK